MGKLKRNWYTTLPTKRMGAGVLLFDNKKRLLIVKPSYKSGWIIPGGVVEKNESPHRAVFREVREEIGLAVKRMKMVGLDYVSASKGKNENLQFIFFGGILPAAKIQAITLASMVAKVTRDRLMKKLHRKYPVYGFDQHKGYGTRQHFTAIKKYGLAKVHRLTFCKKTT